MRRIALPPLVPAVAGALLLSACGGGPETAGSEGDSPPQPSTGGTTTTAGGQPPAGRVDPREDGLEVALGEWAVTPEAKAIRPGRVTFVISNGGTMRHGFELEREEDDSGDRDKVETRFLEPGESTRIEVDLRAGVYKLECNVEGHDDRGMEMLFEVSRDAPLAAAGKADANGKAAVAIEGFAFAPATVEAKVGQKVTWENHDPAEHTVTGEDGGFDSGTLAAGAAFEATFDAPGEYRYICALHPGMKGTVVVQQ
jgi:plastocyanin